MVTAAHDVRTIEVELPGVAPKIEALLAQNVWISAEVVRRALREAGEPEPDAGG